MVIPLFAGFYISQVVQSTATFLSLGGVFFLGGVLGSTSAYCRVGTNHCLTAFSLGIFPPTNEPTKKDTPRDSK